jgi:hypothetical protein
VTEKLQKIIILGCYVLAKGRYWITGAVGRSGWMLDIGCWILDAAAIDHASSI